MLVYKIIIFICCSVFAQLALAVDSKDLLPPEQAFKLSVQPISSNQISVNWDIAEGYYLYRNKIRIESKTDTIKLTRQDFPVGKIKKDEFFGEVVTYRNQLTIPVSMTRENTTSTLELFIQHQGCADIGICYPPQKTTLTVAMPALVDTPPHTGSSVTDPVSKFIQGIGLNLFKDELLPADQAFQFFATVKDGKTLRLNWQIADNYYLYREKFALQLLNADNVELGSYSIPHGKTTHDEAFGKVEILYHQVNFDLPLIRGNTAAQTISLIAKYQGCADRGVCYPPMQKTVQLDLPEINDLSVVSVDTPTQELSEQDQIVRSLQQDTLWLTLLSFLGFGLLLSATPCIFPMIPILSGIIVGHGESITTRKAFLLSLSYVLASAGTYTVFGVLAALFGSNLQATFQEPWIIATFSAIFVLLSLSMFGFYQLELPKFLQAKLHDSSNKHRDGSLISASIMGALSALIVGPCVAAPLAAALIYIGQTGDAILGGSALFMMGLGMGVPLLVMGASAGKLLPKAGTWMNATKAVFGVIMLAVAVWMLERILPTQIIMLFWGMLLIIPAVYLRAIDPLPENASGWTKLCKGSGLVMMTYGVIIMIGLSIGNGNPLKPLQGLSLNSKTSEQVIHFQRIASLNDLDRTLQKAAKSQQWVMLDFYADWCISCKEMESYTFTDPRVKQHLANVILIQADVTANSVDDKALLKRFNLIGPPGIIFFDSRQKQRPELRIIGYKDADSFLTQIQQVGI
jgi:thiol:disulfide interchange protein DsbD